MDEGVVKRRFAWVGSKRIIAAYLVSAVFVSCVSIVYALSRDPSSTWFHPKRTLLARGPTIILFAILFPSQGLLSLVQKKEFFGCTAMSSFPYLSWLKQILVHLLFNSIHLWLLHQRLPSVAFLVSLCIGQLLIFNRLSQRAVFVPCPPPSLLSCAIAFWRQNLTHCITSSCQSVGLWLLMTYILCLPFGLSFFDACLISLISTSSLAWTYHVLLFFLLHPIDFSLLSAGHSDLLPAAVQFFSCAATPPIDPTAAPTKAAAHDYVQFFQQLLNEKEEIEMRRVSSVQVIPIVAELDAKRTLDLALGLLRVHAWQDLFRIANATAQTRRESVYRNDWRRVVNAWLILISAVTVQLKCLFRFLREDEEFKRLALPKTEEKKYVKAIAADATVYAPPSIAVPAEGRSLMELLLESRIFLQAVQNWKGLQCWLEDRWVAFQRWLWPLVPHFLRMVQQLPQRGALSIEKGKTKNLDFSTKALLQAGFQGLQAQSVINAVHSMALLLKIAVRADHSGITLHTVPVVTSALLTLQEAISQYATLFETTRSMKIPVEGKMHHLTYKSHGTASLPTELLGLQTATQEALFTVRSVYADVLSTDWCPVQLQQQLRELAAR